MSRVLICLHTWQIYHKNAFSCTCLNILESNEPSGENQGEREKPLSGKEGTQGACGTAADEKPGN